MKKYFVTDDSPSGIKLEKFTDSYRTAVGSLGVKKNK